MTRIDFVEIREDSCRFVFRLPGWQERRGTAEIEMILSSVVLVTILTLSIGAMRIGLARLDTARTATFEAFHNATVSDAPDYGGDADLPPVEGVGAARPGLPNRTHVPRFDDAVDIYAGNGESLKPVKVGGKAGLAGPPWTFPAYPVGGQDAADTEQWFQDYADESHAEALADPLRLAPAWTP